MKLDSIQGQHIALRFVAGISKIHRPDSPAIKINLENGQDAIFTYETEERRDADYNRIGQLMEGIDRNLDGYAYVPCKNEND